MGPSGTFCHCSCPRNLQHVGVAGHQDALWFDGHRQLVGRAVGRFNRTEGVVAYTVIVPKVADMRAALTKLVPHAEGRDSADRESLQAGGLVLPSAMSTMR